MFWHLSVHVARGTLHLPCHLLLSQTHKSADDTARHEDVLASALVCCEHAISATHPRGSSRYTFLEGLAGPLALKAAILSDACRSQVCWPGQLLMFPIPAWQVDDRVLQEWQSCQRRCSQCAKSQMLVVQRVTIKCLNPQKSLTRT